MGGSSWAPGWSRPLGLYIQNAHPKEGFSLEVLGDRYAGWIGEEQTMKRKTLTFALLLLFGTIAFAQANSQLEGVLGSMDRAAASFKTLQADFVWDQFSAVVSDHDFQEGTMYFRRSGTNIEMAATITKPDQKHILFQNGVVQIYQPKIDQVTKYNAGKNRDTFESFLVLGFGGRGHDLDKSFDVKYGGPETVNGIASQKLLLTPKSEKVRNMFQTIT